MIHLVPKMFRSCLITSLTVIFLSWISVEPAQAITVTLSPNDSIQDALDAASPGDTILLEDGTYYQQVQIHKPITLKAKNPGKVIISGAYSGEIIYTPAADVEGMYSAQLDSEWSVRGVMDGNRFLLDYEALECLKSFKYGKELSCSDITGPSEGFYYDPVQRVLYIRLLNNLNPNSARIEIANRQHNYGIVIFSSNVTIEGLHLRLWPDSAIWLSTNYGAEIRKNISIRHNYFEGFGDAIYLEDSPAGSENIFIENNEFSNYPSYQYRWPYDYDHWVQLYNSNLNTNAVKAATPGLTVRYNYIYESFGGILVRGSAGPSPSAPTDISYNVIRNIGDDAIEPEPIRGRYLDARVHHNFILDVYSVYGFTSYQFGKLQIDHNISYNSPEYGVCAPNRLLKFGTNNGADPNEPYGPIVVVHNTALLCDKGGDYDSHLASGGEDLTYEDSKIQNNLFLVNAMPYNQYPYTGKVDFAPENLIFGTNITQNIFPDALVTDPRLILSPQVDFRLQPGSPAIGAGANHDSEYIHTSKSATDLGAIEYGDSWQMPRPGPSWATDIESRVPLPASLHHSWLGFDQAPRGSLQIFLPLLFTEFN